MPKSKPLTEILTGIYLKELHKMNPEAFPPPENTNQEHFRAHMGAMHQVVDVMQLFGIAVTVDEQGNVQTLPLDKLNGQKVPAADEVPEEDLKEPPRKTRRILKHGSQSPLDPSPPRISHAQSLQMGFTGNMCPECGSMQMTRNGSCEKCMSCGATTGCS